MIQFEQKTRTFGGVSADIQDILFYSILSS